MGFERWAVPPELKQKMHLVAGENRQNETASEAVLWEAFAWPQTGRLQIPAAGSCWGVCGGFPVR